MKAEAGAVFALARVLGCSAEVICGESLWQIIAKELNLF